LLHLLNAEQQKTLREKDDEIKGLQKSFKVKDDEIKRLNFSNDRLQKLLKKMMIK